MSNGTCKTARGEWLLAASVLVVSLPVQWLVEIKEPNLASRLAVPGDLQFLHVCSLSSTPSMYHVPSNLNISDCISPKNRQDFYQKLDDE